MASVLPNASNFKMDNPQFNAIGNQTNIHQSSASDNDPMRMLLSHSALSAMADSPTVYEPTCHPGTRILVSDHIIAWARDPKATPILWLSGPAGAGKSCIQRAIVQSTTAEGLFVACFFFSIKQSETNNQSRFIATLAAQLAENIPGLKWYIERAVKKDSRVFTKALELQTQSLILKPLQELDNSMSNRSTRVFWRTLMALVAYEEDPDTPWTRANVIVVDGLDECVDQTEQTRILGLIHSLATHPHYPFRFAIASRPEYAIRTAFSSPPMSNHTLILRLEEYEADADLRLFLRAEFSHLKSDHPASKSIPTDWPSVEHEDLLITKASRQFVYVSVVMKHLKNPRRNPMLELQQIVGHRPSANDIKSNPFAELDTLYDRILHPPDINTSLLTTILHSIIHDRPGRRPSPVDNIGFPSRLGGTLGPSSRSPSPVDDLDMLLGLEPGTTASNLVDLHSVLNFKSPTPRPTFHHKSLEDFLTSPSRAGDLYQSNDQVHVHLTLAYYELAQRQPGSIGGEKWNFCLLTMSHACSVGNWSLFKREFSEKTLPAFIQTQIHAQIETQNEGLKSTLKATPSVAFRDEVMGVVEQYGGRWLSPYSRQYHSFFCTSKDGCLSRCKQLKLAKFSPLSEFDPFTKLKRMGIKYKQLPAAMDDPMTRAEKLWYLEPLARHDMHVKTRCGCVDPVEAKDNDSDVIPPNNHLVISGLGRMSDTDTMDLTQTEKKVRRRTKKRMKRRPVEYFANINEDYEGYSCNIFNDCEDYDDYRYNNSSSDDYEGYRYNNSSSDDYEDYRYNNSDSEEGFLPTNFGKIWYKRLTRSSSMDSFVTWDFA